LLHIACLSERGECLQRQQDPLSRPRRKLLREGEDSQITGDAGYLGADDGFKRHFAPACSSTAGQDTQCKGSDLRSTGKYLPLIIRRTKVDHPMNVTEEAAIPTGVAGPRGRQARLARQKWTGQLAQVHVSSDSRSFCTAHSIQRCPAQHLSPYGVHSTQLVNDPCQPTGNWPEFVLSSSIRQKQNFHFPSWAALYPLLALMHVQLLPVRILHLGTE
jgi:hypothetical protein